MKRIEPTDLTGGWLGTDQYFAAESVSVDAGDLIIETTNAGPEEPSGEYLGTSVGLHFELSGGSNVTLGDCVIDAEESGTLVVELWKYTQGTNNPNAGTKVDDASISVAAGEQTITLNLTTDGDGDYWVGWISGPALLRTDEGQDYPWTSTDDSVEFVQGRAFATASANTRWYYFFDLQVDSLRFVSGDGLSWRVSNALNVGTVTDVTNSLVKWQATTPTNTDVDVSAAVTDNGDWIGSLYFDGSDDRVEFNDTPDIFTGDADFSIALRAHPRVITSTNPIICTFQGQRSLLVTMGDQDPNNEMGLRGIIGGTWQTPVTTGALNAGQWYSVVYTYSTTNGFICYLDGESVDTSAVTGSITAEGAKNAFGSHWFSGAWRRLFNGFIDDVSIYSRVLSGQEVSDWHDGNVISSTDLEARWDFNDGTGTTLEDSVSSPGSDGTITGATWTPVESGLFQDATNDAAIPGISTGDDLTGKYLWLRQDLSTTGADTPRLESLEYSISSETITRRRTHTGLFAGRIGP